MKTYPLMKLLSCCLLVSIMLTACNLGTPNETPVPTPDLPRVEILSPQNNQQAFEGVEFDFDIVARDETEGIMLVELYVDEVLVNFAAPVEDSTVPVFRTAMNWRATGVGRHLIEVIAYRPGDVQSDPARITIEVLPRDG